MASPTILALPPATRAVAVSYAFDMRISVKDIAERLNVEQESVSELLAFVVLNADSMNLLDLLQVLQRLPEKAEDASHEHTDELVKQETIVLDADEAEVGAQQISLSPDSSLPPASEDEEGAGTDSRSPDYDQNGSKSETQTETAGLLTSFSPRAQDHGPSDMIARVERSEPAQFELTLHLVVRGAHLRPHRRQQERLEVTRVSRYAPWTVSLELN